MKNHTSLFFWENCLNLSKLTSYYQLLQDYKKAYQGDDRMRLRELRNMVIMDAPRAESALMAVGILPFMTYGSRATGSVSISITHQFPELVKKQYTILGRDDDTLEKVDDMYLRAIGIYKGNKIRSILNSFNPFLYVNMLVKVLMLPVYSVLDVPEENQDRGFWSLFQLLLRIPSYYITVLHPILLLLDKAEWERYCLRLVGLL